MPEERTERTTYQGLLALMLVAADTESWGFPYWNALLLDAALAGLAQAPRDGTAHLTAPALAPSTALVTSGGTLAAGQSLEVVQTFVDEYGRETLAGPAATRSTGTPIADPAAAAAFGSVTPAGAGYEGGLFEIWFSWTDGAGGETLPSPVATTDLPYLAGGLLNEIVVDLPSTPAAAGAAGANIYARHRSGNVVLAYQILVDSVSQATLTGVAADCYRTLPLANSTYSSRAVDITGQAANGGESPALTRFYVRSAGATWAAGDRRLKLAGVDEWDPAAVSYPLRYTGATGELAPGNPPSVSQVKAIRPTDLATETTGTLSEAQIDALLARDAEVAALLGGPYVLSGLLVEAQAVPDLTVKTSLGICVSASRIWSVAADTSIGIAAADATNPRIDIVCVNGSGAVVSSAEDALCKGTAAGSPSSPSTPAGYVKLAEVSVPATDTTIEVGQITDSRHLIGDFHAHADASTLHFTGTEKTDRLLSAADKTDLTDAGETTLHTHPKPGGVAFAFPGTLTAGDTVSVILPVAQTIVTTWGKIFADTVPTGAALIIDVQKNGASIYNVTTVNRPTVADSDADGWGAVGQPDTVAFAKGDLMSAVVLQVGSTEPGADVSLTLYTAA